MRAPSAHLTTEIQAERERLATLLPGLSPQQWDTPSLCDGWRVREVVAHLTMPFRTRPLGVIAGMTRAGFSFSRYADRDARAAAQAMSEAELTDLLRRNVGNPWQPPGGGPEGALSHDVIHGLDATEPLGLPAPPAGRIALVLASAGPRQLKFFGVDLTGRRLTATDADVSVGDGANVVTMSAKDILLVVTGRLPVSPIKPSSGIYRSLEESQELSIISIITAPYAGWDRRNLPKCGTVNAMRPRSEL